MSTPPSALERSPQYLNEYRGDTLITIAALFIALESISVILRVYARTITTSTMGWDDILIPLGWLANIGLCVLGITMIHTAGVGYYPEAAWKNHPERAVNFSKSLFALAWLYLTGVALPKMSILFLYLRVFINRRARIVCFV
ncbi:hypothetical protein MMC22_005047 [Lobaria immixta]|nr:hypothetical protein [Lobaria immixta]